MSNTNKPNGSGLHRSLLASMFLGPQAENADLAERLILYVLRDHLFWRRNFQPEDPWVIRESDKADDQYKRSLVRFQQYLVELLGDLKGDNIPFASPRYLGHMLSDQLLPAILGYFAAMLYNPNNVTKEVSPETTSLEEKVIVHLARLVGYDAGAWGHLCSGGTVANLEALWVARNIKYLPASLALLQQQLRKQSIDFDLDLELPYANNKKALSTLTLWELFNIDLATTLRFLDEARRTVFFYRPQATDRLGQFGHRRWRVC